MRFDMESRDKVDCIRIIHQVNIQLKILRAFVSDLSDKDKIYDLRKSLDLSMDMLEKAEVLLSKTQNSY